MSLIGRPRKHPLLAFVSAVILGIVSIGGAAAQTPSADGDDKITGQTYVRHDGATDPGI